MSNFVGTVRQGLRISPHAVQKWMLLPSGEITEWSADGFSLGGGLESARDAIWIADEIRMLFNGESKLQVSVMDEAGQPIKHMPVYQGWPSHKWPEFDDSTSRLTNENGMVEWVLFNEFNPMTDIGPIWVMLNGLLLSDVVMGFGIPTTHEYKALITYHVTFRKVLIKHEQIA